MVINADELDLGGVLWAVVGVVVGLSASGIVIGMVVARLRGRRFGLWSMAVGLLVALALLVDGLVVFRVFSGDVTGWDLCWAAGLTVGAVWSLRRCVPPPAGSAASHQ